MNLVKRDIIPENYKSNIDDILEEQLLNANRNYAEENEEIYRIIDRFIKIRPELYILELKSRWNWHNFFYEDLLEPAYLEIINSDLGELTPLQVEEFISIYKTCLNVDKATMITSCGIKKHLEYWIDKIPIGNEDFTREESLNILLTPLKEPFYLQYRIDHLKYVLLKVAHSDEQFAWKKYLMNQYHANDETIFASRYKKDFQSFEHLSVEELSKKIHSYKFTDSYKVHWYYFMLEHPNRKAFNDIISYDNYDEKLLAFKLIGISGFLYRKKILQYLNDSKILINDGFIYEFSDQLVLDSLKKLLDKSKIHMEKKIKTYSQKGDTCAIVCMLSVLDYYKKSDGIDSQKEQFYYNKYKSNVLIGTPLSAVATELSLNDLDVCLYHSSPNIFINRNGYLPQELFDKGMDEYVQHMEIAKKNGTRVVNGKEIDSKFLLKELQANRMIILAGNHHGFLHTILLCGYDKDKYIIFDPIDGSKKKLTSSQLERFMDTDIGKWCISVKEKTLKKEQLMGLLTYYDVSADEKIHSIPRFEIDKQKVLKR